MLLENNQMFSVCLCAVSVVSIFSFYSWPILTLGFIYTLPY